MRVQINRKMFQWARERSGKTIPELTHKFPKFKEWEAGDVYPTLKQLEKFAKATYLPVGYLFLPDPPVETIPIPDFRTIGNNYIGRPDPDLLDTVYTCQQRQEWYRNYAISRGEDALPFIGSVDTHSDIVSVAEEIRHALHFDIEERRRTATWTEALRQFLKQADDFGIMVMVSSVVGSNNHRKLDPDEFRGFVLSDSLAPLIFINGSDTKSAQMFTLAHEMAHLWLGESALSDINPASSPSNEIENWCNQVAAELLVPYSVIAEEYQDKSNIFDEMNRLARFFKVSTLVIIRRIYDIRAISENEFWDAYHFELDRLISLPASSGGDFYRSQPARLSKRFARAVVISTCEGQSSFTESFRLLGIKKMSTFRDLGASLGVNF
ncbi:ImmA/IrrE family metallo-endopeptidase [bacterium]|nr:ImmA/IrrE family metallo-endopeptidase [bacterium]